MEEKDKESVDKDGGKGAELVLADGNQGEEGGSRVILVADDHGYKHKHSGTLRVCQLQVYGQPEHQTTLTIKICTRVSEVKEMLGNTYSVDPEKLCFVIKEGHFFRVLREAEEMKTKVMVKGMANFKKDFIDEIEHSKYLPAFASLPFKLRRAFPPVAPKTPTVRAFIFYGSADSFAQWAGFVVAMPPWVDVAIYEWPGHGGRKEEETPKDVDGLVDDVIEGMSDILAEHAEGGKAAKIPFVLIGHSIGALIMVGVAERALSSLKVSPWSVIVLDRAPPHIPMCSEFGADMMRNDPEKFNSICNPIVRKMGDDDESQRMRRMWRDEIQLNQDTKPKGFHKFDCPIVVAAAGHTWFLDNPDIQKQLKEAELQDIRERDAIYGSKSGSQAMFDREAYNEWKEWTSGDCQVHDVDTDHFGIKMHEGFIYYLLDLFSRLKKQKSRIEVPEAPAVAPAA